MDPTADPCQDFHQFTCGGYYAKRQQPTDISSISPAKTLKEINDLILLSIVDAPLDRIPKADPGDVAAQNNINKIKDFFSSCMDEAAILEAGRKPLVDEIQKIKLFLSASDSPPDKSTLSKMLALVTKYGFEYPSFIQLRVDSHPTKPSENVLIVNENGLGLREVEDYQDGERLQNYIETTATMFQIVWGYEDVATRALPLAPSNAGQGWLDIAKEVVGFEMQLAGIKTPWSDLLDRAKTNNPCTTEELSALTPSSIDWSLLLQKALPSGLDASPPVIVRSPTYLTKLDALLQKTPAKTLQHYFSWIVIRNLAKHLGEPYKKYLTDFKGIASTVLPGTTNRMSVCLKSVNTNLGHITTHYFVEKTFGTQNRDQIVAIIDSIIDGYEYNFRSTKWPDQITRKGAIKKLKAIVKLVGYTTDNPNDGSSTSLDKYYRDFTVAANDYFGNQVRHSIWSTAKAFSQLPLPRVRGSTMAGPPQEVNAYYKARENSISIMAGMLHMQYFHAENPEYVNYGAIGTIGGHEIGHAFDNNGRLSDSTGGNTKWWTDATTQMFEEKTQCLVRQYGAFTVQGPDGEDLHVNGENTLPENIADNTGAKMAFRT
ncbi:hypothetical protein BG015_001985 [Linnemannia schmuckeri]|uniref:Uncharacterized protein n=1 Tax=Linnemannia schmuckeri TaxID=64567 RepID=A0A9P5RSH3_9FUNG|nr:hypothetical protein BG015_001985 [Linnemannia schmuckeri]